MLFVFQLVQVCSNFTVFFTNMLTRHYNCIHCDYSHCGAGSLSIGCLGTDCYCV